MAKAGHPTTSLTVCLEIAIAQLPLCEPSCGTYERAKALTMVFEWQGLIDDP